MPRILVQARTILRHRDLSAALGCSLLLGFAYSFILPFISAFGTLEVGMTPWEFGGFMTVTALSSIAITTALARWSDTHGTRRSMLLLGSVCGALGNTGYALVRDPLALVAIGSTALAVSSLTFSQLFAHARESLARCAVPAEETPIYMNIYRLFYALAWTGGPAIASWVVLLDGYRGTFLVAAGVFALLAVVVWRFVPAQPRPPTTANAARVSLRHAFRRPDIAVSFAGFVLVFAATTLCMMNLPLFILQSLGGTARHVGIVFSLAPVFELPLMYYFGVLASRGHQDGLIRTGIALALVYYALLALVQAPWQIYPLQILGAAATAVISGIAITYFQNHLPGQAGAATNLYASAVRIGSTAGYLLFGLLATAFGQRGVFIADAALCAITLGLFLFLIPPPPRTELAPAR
ncbi:MAG: sugar efflux transporter [Opitutaceae bacterium]